MDEERLNYTERKWVELEFWEEQPLYLRRVRTPVREFRVK